MTNLVPVQIKFNDITGLNPQTDIDGVEYFLRNQISPNTKEVYFCELKKFAGWVGKAITEVTLKDIIDYKTEISYLKNSTVARKLVILRQFFKFLFDQRYISHNPTLGIKIPKVENEESYDALSEGEVERILGTVDRSIVRGKRDYAVLALCLSNALRLNEVSSINLNDFKEVEGYKVLMVKGKGNKQRKAKLLPRVYQLIKEYVEASGREFNHILDAPLFLSTPTGNNPGRKRLAPRTIQKMVKKYAKKAGVEKKKFSTHSLRVSAITNTIKEGSNILKVARWAGHASIKTTQIYYRDLDELQNNPVDRISFRF